MKSLPFLFIFLFLLTPLISYSQDYDPESVLAATEEEMLGSDLPESEELSAVGEMENQEDMIHPEGENDWSLGGEDLPAEEYE
jgi:hypothetical protein